MINISDLEKSVEGLRSQSTTAGALPSWAPPFQVKYELSGHDSKVSCIAISPDGHRIASASWDSTIRLWDLATGVMIGDALTGHTSFVKAVVFSPDGKFLASASSDDTIRIWDLVTLKSEIVPCVWSREAIAFSPNSQQIASGLPAGMVEVLDLRSRDILFTTARLEKHIGSVASVAYSPNGKYIASGSDDGTICIRDSETGDLIGQPFLHQKLRKVSCVVFSRDGSLLATSCSDKTVKMWSVEDDAREPIKVLQRHRIHVTGVAFSPDGTQLASCAADGICIWDVASGDPVGTTIAYKHAVMVLWSPDGKHLVSAHGNLEKQIVILEVVETVIPEEIPPEKSDWQALATSQNPELNNQLPQERSHAAEFYEELWRSLLHHKDPNFRKKASFSTLFDRDWTGYIKKGKYIDEGGFGNVYMGEWSNLPIQYEGRAIPGVVVKIIRSTVLADDSPSRIHKVLEREVMICSSLRHPNIVPFVGVAFGLSENIQTPSVVSVYMSNGSLKTYCSKNPDILRAPLLLEVGKGIEYLHNFKPKVVHGDIKAENILVDERGRMRLTDFGLSRMLGEESIGATTTTSPTGGTMRWMAPELMNPESKVRTISTASDIYAFAMTALEVISGKVPFPDYNDGAVMVAVCVHDERPSRPVKMKSWLWTLLNKCWVREPEKRLSIGEVVEGLEDVLG